MKVQLSQSLIDKFNLVEIDDPEKDNYRPEYKFRDFVPALGICCGSMLMEVLEWQSKSI